jgi:hypothetical protein
MCDMGEEEWREYLLQVEAAAARARVRAPRRMSSVDRADRVVPLVEAVEAHT